MTAAEIIRSVSLFEGLAPSEIESVLLVCERVHFAAGECLMRQGQPADSAFILESGAVEVVTRLPGGGEAGVGTLGPGSVIGEMALLDRGLRSATVVARKAAAGYFLERVGLHMMLAQRSRAAFRIQSQVTRALCQRLRELNARVVASGAPESAASPLPGQRAEPAGIRRGQCTFDYRAFLPLLPAFKRFSPAEIDHFTNCTETVDLDRGQILFQQGDAGDFGYIVVRGALEILHAENDRRHRIGVLGPGRLCGILALVEGAPHSMSATARERTTLLEFSKPAFDALLAGSEGVSARFREAINRELLQSLARTIVHLTRLISQARIRGGRREKRQERELERALVSQDVLPKVEGA